MQFDKKELKAIQKYLEFLLNNPNSIQFIDNKSYVDTKDLRTDLQYIRECLKIRNENENKITK